MFQHSNISRGLREIVSGILAGSASRHDLNRLIAVSHSLAASFLASKATTYSLTSVHNLNTSDLAYDCIAELFQQDASGNCIQLCTYFASLELASAREEEILAHLRRLVFAKVNQSIFRLYGDADPGLAKILRNIKLAIHSLKNFEEIERFGEPCIVPCLCDPLTHLPPFEPDDVRHSFISVTRGNERIPELLAKLSHCLREQDKHCRILPLVRVAILFRSVYEKKELTEPETDVIPAALVAEDINAIIREACAEIQRQTSCKYVEREKVEREVFGFYFSAIRKTLYNRFIGTDGDESSLYDRLKEHLPELTKREYAARHRNRVEYLLRLVHAKAVKRLKVM